MRHLSAYLMEILDLDDGAGKSLYGDIDREVDEWLSRKGVADTSSESSTFISKTKSMEGTVRQSFFSHEQGTLREVVLEEPTLDGHLFQTTLRVVRTSLRVVVYLALGARNSHSVIRPGFVVPRCPEIIHKIRGLRDDWRLGDTKIGSGGVLQLTEEEDGIALAESITSPRRSIPIVAVSSFDGEEHWPGLSKSLARDLDGLAIVYHLDEAASLGLTDEMGRQWSCHSGAVRLYWPLTRGQGSPQLQGRIWTPSRLDYLDDDGNGLERLRTDLRSIVMSAAALGVEPPFEVQEIKSFRARMRMRSLQAKGQEAAEELELAREFYKENEELREERDALRQVIAQMKGGYEADPSEDEGEDTDEVEGQEQVGPPAPGDIRFYKKRYSTKKHDVFVRISDCEHNNWEAAHSADKAWKGLKRLEKRDDWKTVTHCASCTGGGVWKVQW